MRAKAVMQKAISLKVQQAEITTIPALNTLQKHYIDTPISLLSISQIVALQKAVFPLLSGQTGEELEKNAATEDRTRDLKIFSLTLSQLSYLGRYLLHLCLLIR